MLHQLLLVLFKCSRRHFIKRKVNAILVSIGLTHGNYNPIFKTFSTPYYSNYCYNLLCRYFLFILESLVSFSGLLAMVGIASKKRNSV
jgi:hypothetical protein